MSGSYFTLNAKYNSLLALFNTFFPYPPSPYPPPADVMTLSTAQTATGLKTFSTLPQSSVTPTIGAQLVNKTYVDSLVPTPVNAVTIDGSQTLLTGIKTFTNLPDCSAVPISGSQLVNKTYVDGLTPATATSLAGGVASQIPFQSAPSTTSFIANGTAGQYLQSNGLATPSWATIPVIPSTPNLSSVLSAGNTANTSINMNGFSINNINTLTTNQAGLSFLPQATVQAVSNTPINIPVYGGDHQILLKASPVPVFDTLVVQTQFIGSGSVNCSAVGAGFQWLGTNNGEIYCYDVATNNWTLVAQFNGPIYALFYSSASDRLYIGGNFFSCSNPSTPNPYSNVAYIPAPSTSLIIPDNLIWSGASFGGFNGAVNAITSDGGDFVYFGGNFTNNADITLILNFFACYDQTSNVLSPIDNNTANGFNGAVYNLDYLSGSICATGQFTQITTGGVPTNSFYCVVFAINGNAVSSVNALDGGSTSLSTGIGGYDFIDNDGTEFLVVINESYSAPSYTLNYLMKVSTSGVSSTSGSNTINAPLTSFFRKVSTGQTHAITNINDYYIDSALATAMGNNYFTFNYIGSDIVYFNLQGIGSQWAFVGASYNNFLLGGGRQILWYDGSVFTTGYLAQTPNYGATLLLQWNGTYYVQICSLGSPTSWSPYT
jgi:hypothetical protein